MIFGSGITDIDIFLKVVFIDLLLSGDNAVVIALACRSLPEATRRRAILFGTGAAIGLRFLLTATVGAVLTVPYLKMVGALALLVIAIKLVVGDEPAEDDGATAADGLWAAVRIIVIADLVMSFDNVVALAAAVRGSYLYLGLGLLLSVPLLIYGSTFVGRLLQRFPVLVTAGGGLLGWLAGDMAITDPALAAWIDPHDLLLQYGVPFAAALTATLHGAAFLRRRQGCPVLILRSKPIAQPSEQPE
jgi:YjbE family integral membrane protein